eukprot:353344_1
MNFNKFYGFVPLFIPRDTNMSTLASPKPPPTTERRHSITHSVASMKDWMQRQLTIEDIEDFMDLDETDDKIVHHKLQTRLDTYNGPNPFVHVLPFTCYEKLKILLFTITGILLIKILISILIVIFCYFGCLIKNCCCKNKNSIILNLYLRAWVRVALFFIFGFYWIPVSYENKKPKNWPKIITPNHISLIDAFILYYQTGAVFVAKQELENIPILGGMMTAIGVVYIDRSSKAARREVVNTIKKHAQNPNSVPLAIFPQGTCSNTKTLTQFKCGAFIPGVKVLPTAVVYTNWFCDMALLGGLFLEGVHACCQFINFARIKFLQPYEPSEQEKTDPVLFANNVRKVVADALNAELTPHSFDDLLLQAFAANLKTNNEKASATMMTTTVPFIMDDVHRKLQMKAKTVIQLAKIYMKHCDDNGRITLETFCKVFHIKDQILAHILFELIMGERDNNPQVIKIQINHENVEKKYEEKELKQNYSDDDKIMNKFIMFDDFLVGVAICYQYEHIDDALTLFYSMMDREGDGYIKVNDVVGFVKLVEKDAVEKFKCDVNGFCLKVFDIEDISVDKKLNFQQFNDNVKFHKETEFVQKFLQFIIFTFLEIKLDENMIVVKKE